mmetsp:Transcript_32026/g.51512  ORF Transcript_32026/g.51512 Transcript_32026/m.51512 type:complete len:80 (-) Transcript_32026:23-262(-)
MPEAPPESASYCSTSVAFLQLLFEAKSWLAFVMTATELSLPRSLDGSSCEERDELFNAFPVQKAFRLYPDGVCWRPQPR